MTLLPAVAVDGHVAGDAEQPGALGAALGVVLVLLAPGEYQGLLDDLLGLPGVRRAVPGPRVEGGRVGGMEVPHRRVQVRMAHGL